MEEIAEQHEVSNEITQAISNPIGLQNDIDDDELLKELAEMEEVIFTLHSLALNIYYFHNSRLKSMKSCLMLDQCLSKMWPANSQRHLKTNFQKRRQRNRRRMI
jgi:hypothetical protein